MTKPDRIIGATIVYDGSKPSTEGERARPWRRVTEIGAHPTLGTVLKLECGHSLYGVLPWVRVRCVKCKPRSDAGRKHR